MTRQAGCCCRHIRWSARFLPDGDRDRRAAGGFSRRATAAQKFSILGRLRSCRVGLRGELRSTSAFLITRLGRGLFWMTAATGNLTADQRRLFNGCEFVVCHHTSWNSKNRVGFAFRTICIAAVRLIFRFCISWSTSCMKPTKPSRLL